MIAILNLEDDHTSCRTDTACSTTRVRERYHCQGSEHQRGPTERCKDPQRTSFCLLQNAQESLLPGHVLQCKDYARLDILTPDPTTAKESARGLYIPIQQRLR